MPSPLVSVVMTVYNAEKYLAECMKSVLNQSHKNLQFIIIDDGSTDASADIVRSFSDPRIEFYQLEENRHISYATNIGFTKVRGDYLAIMDSDDIWVETKLEKQLDYLAAHPEHQGCFTWADLIDGEGNLINDKMPDLKELFSASTETREYWLRFFFFLGNRLNNPSSLVESKTLEVIGGHNLFYIQATDMEWWVRFTQHFSFGILEEPLIRYRRILDSGNSVSSVTEEHDARFYNEYMQIRYHFFDTMDDDLFLRTFRDSFRCKDSSTPQELACEKAFLICQTFNHSSAYSALGLLKIEELLKDPETADLLKNRYHFSTKECGLYTGTHLYNDHYLQKLPGELQKLEVCCQNLKLQIQKLEAEQKATLLQTQKLENVIREQEVTIQNQENTIQNQENLVQFQEHTISDLTDTVNTITNSTIWKSTAPFRKWKDKIKH